MTILETVGIAPIIKKMVKYRHQKYTCKLCGKKSILNKNESNSKK